MVFNYLKVFLVQLKGGLATMQSGYFLIADISGYTEFVQLHTLKQKPLFGKFMAKNFENHASIIISDLLESVIEAIEPTMKLHKLEGDAAFFYIEENSQLDQADKIITAMGKANEAFTNKASDLLFVQACGCEPCSQSKNLKLKIVAHKGTCVTQKIRNFEEISGEDVILTHRLLKNNIPSIEYWLVTKEFAKNLSKDNKRKFSPSSQSIENFGKIGLLLCEFNSGEPINTDVGKRSRAINWIIQASYFTKHTLKSPLRKI